jgi:polyribonucleotide nucleotidyltransferase
VSIETGRIGLQANGAVMVTEGETVMYTTICAGREVTADGGFVPLTVNYQVRSQPSTTVDHKTRPL